MKPSPQSVRKNIDKKLEGLLNILWIKVRFLHCDPEKTPSHSPFFSILFPLEDFVDAKGIEKRSKAFGAEFWIIDGYELRWEQDNE